MPRISGLPRGMVPRLRPPVDMSRYLGSYRDEVRRLHQDISKAEWDGDRETADRLSRELAWVQREQRDARTGFMPLF